MTSPPTTYDWPILPAVVEAICKAIDSTGEPERVPELHKQRISKSESFRIVRPVSIPRDRRVDGGRAPCPMCQPNKFFDGNLVWLPNLRALAVIGHCCASANTRTAADNDYRQRVAKERAGDYLLVHLLKTACVRTRLPQLRDEVQVSFDACRQLAGSGGFFTTVLRRATQREGQLVVNEVLAARMVQGIPAQGAQIRMVRFGALTGTSALKSRSTLVDDMRELESALSQMPLVLDEDDVLDYLAAQSDTQLLALDRDLRRLLHLIASVEERTVDVRQFFTAGNVAKINKWGAHPDVSVRMSAILRRSKLHRGAEFILSAADKRVVVSLPDEHFHVDV